MIAFLANATTRTSFMAAVIVVAFFFVAGVFGFLLYRDWREWKTWQREVWPLVKHSPCFYDEIANALESQRVTGDPTGMFDDHSAGCLPRFGATGSYSGFPPATNDDTQAARNISSEGIVSSTLPPLEGE